VVANIGALLGGILFGNLVGAIGRRRAIVIAALLAIPVIFVGILAYRGDACAGRISDAVHVQGAWGVIPAI